MTLRLVRDNLVTLDVDAIVNAANNRLARGGGVCGAIFSAAGPEAMTRACREAGPCPTGGAVMTPGFNLKARHVIHAVGPVWRGGDQGEPAELRSCYATALTLAADHGLESIAFPLISAGIYGYPRPQALTEAMGAIRAFQEARLESGGPCPRVLITLLGDAADMVDPDLPADLSKAARQPGPAEAAVHPADLAEALAEVRASGPKGPGRLALAANLEAARLASIASGDAPGRSELLALAVGLGWSPGRARAALEASGHPPKSEPDWLITAHYLAHGPADIHRINRSLFGLGLPILP